MYASVLSSVLKESEGSAGRSGLHIWTDLSWFWHNVGRVGETERECDKVVWTGRDKLQLHYPNLQPPPT